MNLSTAKQVSSRDSATAALRKLGVAKIDYDDYIVRRDGTYYVDVKGAEASMTKTAAAKSNPFAGLAKAAPATQKEKMASAAAEVMKEMRAEKKVAAPAAPKADRITVSGTIRTMIKDGKSNQEIWDALGPQGSGLLKDTQRSYPSWYRCELARTQAKA